MAQTAQNKQLADLIILRGLRIKAGEAVNELNLKINLKLSSVRWA